MKHRRRSAITFGEQLAVLVLLSIAQQHCWVVVL